MARHFLADGTVPLVWLTRMPDGPDEEDLAWAAAVDWLDSARSN